MCFSVDWSTAHVPFSLFSHVHTYIGHRIFSKCVHFFKLIHHASKIVFLETEQITGYIVLKYSDFKTDFRAAYWDQPEYDTNLSIE